MDEAKELQYGPPDRRGDLEAVLNQLDFSYDENDEKQRNLVENGLMTAEKLADEKKQNLRFSLEQACKNIDKTGLPHDTFNNFYGLSFVDDYESANEILKSLLTYKEYLETQMPELAVDFILRYTEPGKVKEFDQLVEAANSDMERIKKEKDFDSLKEYVEKARRLIKGK